MKYFLSFFFSYTLLFTQDMNLGATLRTRFESIDKDFTDSTTFNSFHAQRFRFHISFKQNDVELFFQLQDFRLMGSETSTLLDGSSDNFDLHQGYIKISKLMFLDSFKLGRFEQAFGNQRIIGNVGWHNIGRSFDGVVLSHIILNHKVDYFKFNLFETYPELLNENDGFVSGINVSFHKSIKFINETLFVIDNDRKTSHTSLGHSLGNLNINSEFGYQFGHVDSLDQKSWMASFSLSYNLKSLIINSGMDFISGDNSSTAVNESFNTLFSTNHKFYGSMDYFLNLPVHTNNLGLIDFYMASKTQNFPININTSLHHFLSHREDKNGNDTFGTEVDISLPKNIKENVNATFGYSIFLPGKIKSESDQKAQWVFLMISASFK